MKNAGVILGVLSLAVGCWTPHYNYLVIATFKVEVVNSEGRVIGDASIWLDDLSVPKRYRGNLPEGPICITEKDGSCIGTVKYRYAVSGRGPAQASQPQLELRAVAGDWMGTTRVRNPTSAQLAGLEEIRVKIIVSQ